MVKGATGQREQRARSGRSNLKIRPPGEKEGEKEGEK